MRRAQTHSAPPVSSLQRTRPPQHAHTFTRTPSLFIRPRAHTPLTHTHPPHAHARAPSPLAPLARARRELAAQCWAPDPADRPTSAQRAPILRRLMADRGLVPLPGAGFGAAAAAAAAFAAQRAAAAAAAAGGGGAGPCGAAGGAAGGGMGGGLPRGRGAASMRRWVFRV
jgi:hypothetical protein